MVSICMHPKAEFLNLLQIKRFLFFKVVFNSELPTSVLLCVMPTSMPLGTSEHQDVEFLEQFHSGILS